MIIEEDVIAIILMLGITGARVTFPGLATGSYLATKASLFSQHSGLSVKVEF